MAGLYVENAFWVIVDEKANRDPELPNETKQRREFIAKSEGNSETDDES